MQEERDSGSQREELLDNIRRLTRTIQDRLELGIRDSSLSQGEVRMLGSIVLRSLRLWDQILGKKQARELETSARNKSEA